MKRILGITLSAVMIGSSALAQEFPAPSQGCTTLAGAERREVLDIIRQPVARALRSNVEFVVERARVCHPFAFVLATPRRPGGGAILWTGTPCEGDTSHLVGALLRRGAGGWRLLAHALCPSDVAWADWPERFGAPETVFGD